MGWPPSFALASAVLRGNIQVTTCTVPLRRRSGYLQHKVPARDLAALFDDLLLGTTCSPQVLNDLPEPNQFTHHAQQYLLLLLQCARHPCLCPQDIGADGALAEGPQHKHDGADVTSSSLKFLHLAFVCSHPNQPGSIASIIRCITISPGPLRGNPGGR